MKYSQGVITFLQMRKLLQFSFRILRKVTTRSSFRILRKVKSQKKRVSLQASDRLQVPAALHVEELRTVTVRGVLVTTKLLADDAQGTVEIAGLKSVDIESGEQARAAGETFIPHHCAPQGNQVQLRSRLGWDRGTIDSVNWRI